MEAQWEEFECMRSMFHVPDELEFDAELVQEHERAVLLGGPPPSARLQYTIRYKDLCFGREIPALEVTYPLGYPQHDAVEFTVRCPFLTRQQTEALHSQLVLLATGADGEVIVLQLYQQMLEVLLEAHRSSAVDRSAGALPSDLSTTELPSATSSPHATPVLGRRAIYFHHIINATKRRAIKEWALELQLGGFSKIGWPGVVIVEGRELDVQEYVRRLQHLRWKQIVVRGEQTETSSDPMTSSIDVMRRLPRGFQEFPENGMSALSAACRDAGVEELFLTTMKIYGRSDTSEPDKQQNEGRRRSSRRKDTQHTT